MQGIKEKFEHKDSFSLKQAALAVKEGKTIIYPTETLYALGCGISKKEALQRIFEIKARPKEKTLPLILGSREQAGQVLREESTEFAALADLFWPGPLSIIAPAKSGLSDYILNEQACVCLRQTSNPAASRLCQLAGEPLVATSANLSGQREVSRLEELDLELLRMTDFICSVGPSPSGGLPSTIVKLIGSWRIKVLRPGAVPLEVLRNFGFYLER